MSLIDELLPETGEIIAGRYRIVDRLGRGAFGVVYRAEMESLGSEVAVKVLLPHIAEEPRALQRFEQEIAIVRNLHHPNTIRVLDVARTRRGLPLYVMELLYGQTLSEVLAEGGAMSDARVAHIALQILGALSEAHRRGVVHRDLKPANVMLCDIVGAPDFVKVLDFGVAKSADGGPSATQTGAVIGTPFYMSPEQASGSRDLDGRSDLYSLGILMAEALGAPPYGGDLDPLEHLAAHLADEALPLPESLHSSALWDVIARATAKAKNQRFADAAAMREAIEAAAAGASDAVVVRPSGAPARRAPATPIGFDDTYVAPAGPPPPVAATHETATPAQIDSGREPAPVDPSLALATGRPARRVWQRRAAVAALFAAIVVVALAALDGARRGTAPPKAATPPPTFATAPVDAESAPGPELEPSAQPGARPEDVRMATTGASAAVHGALPVSHDIAVDGPAGATLWIGERELGSLPASVLAPSLATEVAVRARRGDAIAERTVSLADTAWDLGELSERAQRRETATESERSAAQALPDPPRAEPPEAGTGAPAAGAASPFGAAPIHD